LIKTTIDASPRDEAKREGMSNSRVCQPSSKVRQRTSIGRDRLRAFSKAGRTAPAAFLKDVGAFDTPGRRLGLVDPRKAAISRQVRHSVVHHPLPNLTGPGGAKKG
jgi:hypothetical protein